MTNVCRFLAFHKKVKPVCKLVQGKKIDNLRAPGSLLPTRRDMNGALFNDTYIFVSAVTLVFNPIMFMKRLITKQCLWVMFTPQSHQNVLRES